MAICGLFPTVGKSSQKALSINIKEVQVLLVNEIEGAHVPMLLVSSSMNAKAIDWSAQLKVEADVAVQISYYNECLAAWEPLLEPAIVGQEKTMWEVQLKLFLADAYVSSFSPKDVDSCDGPPRDASDGSQKTPLARDVTDSRFWSLAQRRSSFRRIRRSSSFKFSGRQTRSRKKLRRHSTGTKFDGEDDLDYEGAMSTFVLSTQKAFSDPYSEFNSLDVVDAPNVGVDAEPDEKQSQATYIVINSHDVMQLTVTPTALQILSELSQLWTTERTKTLRTVPGPTFLIHNQLGIHAAVTVSPRHQIPDGNQLTVRSRVSKQPVARLASLADVIMSQRKGVKRVISEPLFNRLREKLHKIRRKRASSEPISLEAIRQRKYSLQNTTTFQVGQPLTTKFLKKGVSVDSGMDTNGKAVTLPPRPRLLSGGSSDHSTEGSHVGNTVANIGSIVGGIFAPHKAEESMDGPSGNTDSGSVVAEDDDNTLSLTVDGFYNVPFVSFARSGSYLFKLTPKDAILREASHKWYVVVQVEIKNGRKTVTIRSPLQIQNHLQIPVDIFVKRNASSEPGEEAAVKLFTVEPGGRQNLPLYTAYHEDIFVKPCKDDFHMSSTALSWRKFRKEEPSCLLACPSLKDTTADYAFYIKALCQTDGLNKLPSDQESPHHVIHLHPPLVVHNKLPFELEVATLDRSSVEVVQPGEKLSIVSLCPGDAGQMSITMKNYKGVDWIGHMAIRKEPDKSLVLLMKSKEKMSKDLLLGVRTMVQSGTREMLIYSPYWLINKTGLRVEYRVSKTKQVYVQSAVDKHPLLFNFTGTTYRKAKLRLPGHGWSRKFSLDAVGDSGKVICKANDGRKFEFILQIEMSRTGLTKIVTLTPKFVIINNTEISVSFIENKCKSALWFVVEPGESKPFWPIDKSGVIVLKATMSDVISKPFSFNTSHTTVLRIAELQALTVEVHSEVEDAVTTIAVTYYTPGVGTIRMENLCENTPIRFNQKDSGQVIVLNSKEMILYTWDDPQGDRKLLWKAYTGVDKPVDVPVDKDGFGEIRVELDEISPPVNDERKQLEDRDTTCGLLCGSSAALPDVMDRDTWDNVDGPMQRRVEKTIYWVSVMDGLQRVLIFTDNKDLSCLARKCCDFEVVNMELFMSLDGVGLSLVNSKPDEVAYITLSSSSSVWQVEGSSGRWKTLNFVLSTWLEDAWRNDADGRPISLDDREVDFNSMRMTRPHKGAIRRLFEPALWFSYTRSDHYHSLHCKIHRIQIDNQQFGTVFPVALYPSPLPSSIIQKSGFKPFIEMSIIYHQVPKEGVYHIKYAKALVQEMNVKVDKGFIISMAGLFSQQKELLEEESYFEEDLKRVAVPLRETEAVKAALETQRVFLEYFHLSPFKINLSFSLASSFDEEDEEQAFAQDLWDFFIDSVGATLTDINDAELRLAYFERVSVFLTQENLVAQIMQHYTMQGIRQVYVLVLGLDVLGNPYGLIHGIGEGVKDFFYEPYQGIIAGPGEFAEGVARGVKSLLGHVIGGTAGAFSRITGSLGQAVATLTFDSKFQMRRRLRMHREPHGIGQGLVMGGKSLLMGLVFGVSGVVMKPVEGARSEGVEGFFKGIGKGLLGLLTHPTGGVIDMVSFTLDGVRRSAEFSGEDIVCRMRLPRFTAPNMPLKPFSEHDAKGNGILKSLEQGDEVYVDHMTVTDEQTSFVVLLTDRGIFNLNQSKFWLGWKIRWSCLYKTIAGFPCLTANALVIKRKSDKDEGSTVELTLSEYEIFASDKAELETLKSKIDNAIRHYR